ncbi:MAG: efflux RND transporter permease subunit [Pirellulales bacterium]
MQLIDGFVRSPVKVAVGVLLVALFGYVALIRMPMQLTPEVQRPALTIETRWPGASPQEVEQEIILEQEEQLKSVEGVTKLTSESMDSMGRITMEFGVDANMSEIIPIVNSRLQQVPEYPEDADEPVISTANSSDQPIGWFILSVKPPSSEELDAFAQKYPQLADKLAPVRHAHNIGVAIMRLRKLGREHPEFKELLPPESLDVAKLRRFAEDEIEARFERVPGVSQSNVMGGYEDELQVVVDPEKLAARQITLTDVRNVLRGQNDDISAGDFWEGKRRWVVRALGQFRSPEQVENQLLAVRDGAPVFVRDVGEVRLGYKKPDGIVSRLGESNIAVNCLRETGANVLDVMDGLRKATDELNRYVLNRRNLELTQVYDETDYIYSSVDLVKDNIFVGGALTMIVLMLFLHLGVRTLVAIPLILGTAIAATFLSPWFFALSLVIVIISGFWFARGALVVGLAIPISIIGSFLVLGMLGRSLNVISLAGLAFAVGMLVDNAVVVLENIYRRYSLGEPPFTAAVHGTQEVWGAVAASTLTTIAVFLPVVFVQEEAGQLFRDIALAISAGVGLSMLVSLSVIPMAAARLFSDDESVHEMGGMTSAELASHLEDRRGGANGQGPLRAPRHATPAAASGLQRFGEAIVAPIEAFAVYFVESVVAINAWVQQSVVRRLAVVLFLVGASAGVTWALWPHVEYLPTGNRNLVFGVLLPPPGYNIDQLLSMGRVVEQGLKPYADVDPESPEAAALDAPVIEDFFFVARGRQVFIGMRAHDQTRAAELVPLVQRVGSILPGTFAVGSQASLFGRGLEGGRTIDVEITGPELSKLVQMGGQVLGQVMQNLPNSQPRPVPSLDLSSPEVHITPKLVQAADMRVSTTDLGFAVNALIDGAYVSDYYLDGKKIDLTLTGTRPGNAAGLSGFDEYRWNTQDVQALPIATPLGQLVPLSALAEVTLASGPEQVNHRERVRAITIQVSPPAAMPLEAAMSTIQEKIVQPMRESGQLDGGYQVNLAGTADKLRDTWNALRFNVILALVITYLLMAALFESWLYPLVIIFSVPLGAVGGVLGLLLLNWYLRMTLDFYVPQTLDVLTMLGFVILIGTVVNNPILIVHQSLNHMREDGMTSTAAILESVRTRIRPIFMTTMTTVLGLMPLVLFPGAGSELYRGLGAVVLGGLLLSTIFTLVLVPALFSLTMDLREWFVGLLFGHKMMTAAAPVGFSSQATKETVHDVPASRPRVVHH